MYDSETIAALQAGALILRDMLYVRALDGSNVEHDFGFWMGEDDVTITVVKATDPAASESRNYAGGGALLDIDPIPYQLGIVAQTINIKLSQIHATVQDMLRGYNIRLAEAEVHRALFDVSTGNIVSTPFPRFYGLVEGAPLETPAIGSDGSVSLAVTGISIILTRTNPALKSDEQQKLRGGDRFRQYSDAAGSYDVWWGEARGTA